MFRSVTAFSDVGMVQQFQADRILRRPIVYLAVLNPIDARKSLVVEDDHIAWEDLHRNLQRILLAPLTVCRAIM
jgi:hypothetical protein